MRPILMSVRLISTLTIFVCIRTMTWSKGGSQRHPFVLRNGWLSEHWVRRLLQRRRHAGAGQWRPGDYCLLDIDDSGRFGRGVHAADRNFASTHLQVSIRRQGAIWRPDAETMVGLLGLT